MLKEYPNFKKGEVEGVFKNIPREEKKVLKEYLIYRKARGLNSEDKVNDVRRYILHLRHILGKSFKKITLQEYREILAIVNKSDLASNTKNHIKVDFKNFLKYIFPDWSERFYGFEDIKLDSSRNEEKINSGTIFTKEDINKLASHEQSLYWKSFLVLQYEGGLRTIEVRTLEWNNIKFNVDGDISEINVYSTKTKKARPVYIKDSTPLLKKLKEEQENQGNKGLYVFHSKIDKDKPVTKPTVSFWFRKLTQKTLGRKGWNYLLRHSRATELYALAEDNKISKDMAVRFMGHSKDMSPVYTHLDKKRIQQMLKEQIYKEHELNPEEKTKLEKRIAELEQYSKEGLADLVDMVLELTNFNKEVGKLNQKRTFQKLLEMKEKFEQQNQILVSKK